MSYAEIMVVLTGTALVAFLVIAFNRAADAKPQSPLKTFMRPKLVHTERILEALLESDFPTIEDQSKSLLVLSRAAQWQVEQTPEYQKASEDFRSKVEALLKAAQQKKIQEATKAYHEVTASCVQCHNRNRGK